MSTFNGSENWAMFLPRTPGKCEIPPAFSSPPPSNPPAHFPSSRETCTPNSSSTNSRNCWSSLPARLLELTPDPFMSPDHRQQLTASGGRGSSCKKFDSGKRGRPRADVISNLMMEGSSSPSEIKCNVCHRVFPREKSLQAHLRTHTGEKPYVCDYPGCSRAFTQSGQLKTHQRLHAGEKPFICSANGCSNRYTHANRTCPTHPYHKPQRSADLVLQPVLSSGENAQEVQVWLENYRRERLDKTPGKVDLLSVENEAAAAAEAELSTPQKKPPKSKRGLVSELEQENVPLQHDNQGQQQQQQHIQMVVPPMSPLRQIQPRTPSSARKRSILEDRLVHLSPSMLPARRTLGDITSSVSTSSSNVPKKRWLKEVFFQEELQRQQVKEEEDDEVLPQEVLARPIRWNEEEEQQRLHRRSPKSWIVATALVELGSDAKAIAAEQNQPLNLSLSSKS